MTIVVLLVLAAIWAAVLLPPYLQKRRATHPSSSVVDFHQQLAVLQRTGRPLQDTGFRSAVSTGVYSPSPAPRMGRADVMRRRRDVFTTLSSAAVLTFFLALLLGGNVWLLHLLVDAALLGYVALLMQIKQQRPVAARATARPAADVRYLAPRRQSATQQALLRRPAN